jgi:hypothetical protein
MTIYVNKFMTLPTGTKHAVRDFLIVKTQTEKCTARLRRG